MAKSQFSMTGKIDANVLTFTLTYSGTETDSSKIHAILSFPSTAGLFSGTGTSVTPNGTIVLSDTANVKAKYVEQPGSSTGGGGSS